VQAVQEEDLQWNGSSECIVLQTNFPQLCQGSNFARNLACKRVVACCIRPSKEKEQWHIDIAWIEN
jgi:hypothetical protein